jgi:hypothetical protein
VIEVSKHDGNEFEVRIKDAKGETRHRVTMSPETFKGLTDGRADESECVRAAFRFLLDREAKEQILAQFDVTVISRYFPEFERELPKYLTR